MSNIPPKIREKVRRNLHCQKFHPVEIIKVVIYKYFGNQFVKFDDLSPYVSVENYFDRLLIPIDHPARSKSDTYYVDDTTVLRTHTSAHQSQLLSKGFTKFLVTGDVYRKDEVDHKHYPIFHQMEGVCLVDNPENDLKKTLNGLIDHLFPKCE